MKRETVFVDFVIGGRQMTAGNAPADLRDKLARVEDDFRRALGDIKVPEDKPIRVKMIGDTFEGMQFFIEGDKAVIEEAQKRLGGSVR